MNYSDKYKRESHSEAPFLLCLEYPHQPADDNPEGGQCDCKDELLSLVVATYRHHHVPS